ncbi:MAG TPA: YciI family protein [Gemmatimonadales bacterium]|nr:YciI family protein [Gemmatimonadales bacterium]
MRFMMLYKPGRETDAPPSEQEIADMGELIQAMARAGVLLAADGLKPSSKGSRVRIAGEKFTVIDGPFTETKELIAGYAIVQVETMEEALAWAKRFLTVTGEGESEIREMHDAPAFDAKALPPRAAQAGQRQQVAS